MTVARAYDVLGLRESATTAARARATFRRLVRQHHPDVRPPHERAAATERTRLIVEAYEVLRQRGFPPRRPRPRHVDVAFMRARPRSVWDAPTQPRIVIGAPTTGRASWERRVRSDGSAAFVLRR